MKLQNSPQRRLRNQRGQSLTVPAILITLLIIGVIGIFSFEVARSASARDQLRTATESAALAGAAALASFPQDDPSAWHSDAIAQAKSIFAQNEVYGISLNGATEGDGIPTAGQTLLQFQFIDPTTKTAVAFGDPKGKVMEITAKYGYTPLFASFIGSTVAVLPLHTQASGGLGELDVALCFDCSGSMEFETFVTEVRRTWDPVAGKIQYQTVSVRKNTSEAIRPQHLFVNAALRGATDSGSPPGNFPPGVASNTGVTDAVVNIDEKPVFAGLSEGGFDFPDVATLVEASRGNLESAAAFNASQANVSLSGGVGPKPGYQAKYFELARKHTHPFAEAEQAAKNFYKLMNRNTRAHFGFVAFQAQVGETSSTSFPESNVDSSYPPGGIGNFALPGISLVSDPDTTNFDTCTAAVGTVVPEGGTNIGGSVERAIRMFTTGSRPNARKAIIVFTDGSPTSGGPLSGDPETNCRLAAQLAHDKSIAIYTVGMALDPSLIPEQQRVLGDKVPTGMAFIAGNDSKFFQVTDPSQLNAAFTAIARQLTQLVE